MCDWTLFGICFYKAGSDSASIFGFSTFLSSLALLSIIYTVTDFRYKFRIAVAPYDLKWITFQLIGLIGIGTLVSELWVAQSWPTLKGNLSQAVWQSIFAFIFLIIVSRWMKFAFMSPPVFDKNNYKRFSDELYKIVSKGEEEQLKIVVDELRRSLNNLINECNNPKLKNDGANTPNKDISLYAQDMILLLANKKVCRVIAKDSPKTAIEFFVSLSKHNSLHSSAFETLSRNLSSAFLMDTDSLIYHEDDGYDSGLLGYIKPLTTAMYGDYGLVEINYATSDIK